MAVNLNGRWAVSILEKKCIDISILLILGKCIDISGRYIAHHYTAS